MCLDFEAAIIPDDRTGEASERELGEGDELPRQIVGFLKMLGQPPPPEEVGQLWQPVFI